MAGIRYDATDLTTFADALLRHAGLPDEKALAVAEILVEGDLLGHSTHGLQLLAPYLEQVENGAMTVEGEPEIVADHGSTVLVDGRYLPGPWLVLRAMDRAFERAAAHGVVTTVIRRSHHIACLQAYLERVTRRDFMAVLCSSDPAGRSVAPHGGTGPAYTPNPIAVGIPTDGTPILIDVSTSSTTNGLTARLRDAGERLPHAWVTDSTGRITDDPSVLFTQPPGAILPLGGLSSGHKGFALALMVEALTSALGGFGRADGPTRWGASVFLQIIDPNAFGGAEAFRRETGWLATACRSVPVRPEDPPVRLPGEGALARRAAGIADGLTLHSGIMESLRPWARKFDISIPPRVEDKP